MAYPVASLETPAAYPVASSEAASVVYSVAYVKAQWVILCWTLRRRDPNAKKELEF